MSLAVDPHPKGELFQHMPLDVAGIIRDEAQLKLARETLERELEGSRQRLHTARTLRSWWTYLTQASYRRDHHRTRSQQEADHHELHQLLRQVKALQKRLSPPPPLRAAIAQKLGALDESFRRGLRAARYHEYWNRRYLLVRDRLGVLRHALTQASAAVHEDQENRRKSASPRLSGALEKVGQAAVELDEQIQALAHVCTAHAELVHGTPFYEVNLPHLADWHCVPGVAGLHALSLEEIAAKLRALGEHFGHDKLAVLETLETLFQDAAALHTAAAESYLADAWQGMVTHAERHWVKERHLPEVVAEIEHRQLEAERARWAREISLRQGV